MAFPVPKQLITNETETTTRRKIPSMNTEQTFHPDSIYRPFPRPLQNLQPNSPENEPDTKTRVDLSSKKTPYIRRELFLNFIKSSINLIFKNQKI